MSEQSVAVPQLLLSVRDAAKALAICERKLWELTKRGEIHCVRIGRRVLYDPRDLTRWIDGEKGGSDDDSH